LAKKCLFAENFPQTCPLPFLFDGRFAKQRRDECSTSARSSRQRADFRLIGSDPTQFRREQSSLPRPSCSRCESTCNVVVVHIGIRAAHRCWPAVRARKIAPSFLLGCRSLSDDDDGREQFS